MPAFDVYGSTDKLDETTLDVIASRLESRGRHPLFAQMLQDYLETMDIDSANKVLDIGCGTGVAAKTIAKREGFSGSVLGIDLSDFLIATATRLAAEEGLSSAVSFEVGDSRSLELKDNSFDAVVLHTLVSHLDNPLAGIKEAARVVKPGGVVGIFDGDYASLTFGNENPEHGRVNDDLLISAVITQARVMRQMPRLLKKAGLNLISSKPYILAEVGQADFWIPALKSFERLLPASGAMTEAQAKAYVATLLEDSEDGVFFGSSNFYSYVAERPVRA